MLICILYINFIVINSLTKILRLVKKLEINNLNILSIYPPKNLKKDKFGID